jgi:hypothetical protein
VSNEIIKLAITDAVSAYNSSHSQLQYAINIFDTVAFAFPITSLALNAFYILYSEYTAGTISDFTDASTDPVLWADVTCAIYSATQATGYITAANLPAVIANVCGIGYIHSDVITAICNFVTNVGLPNLQAMQNIGVVDIIDCTTCSTWCRKFDFSIAQGASTSFGPYGGVYVGGVGWHSTLRGGFAEVSFDIPLGLSAGITDIEIEYSTTDVSGGAVRRGYEYLATVQQRQFDMNPANTGGAFITSGDHQAHTVDEIACVLRCTNPAAVLIIKSFEIGGVGVNPFGANNCTYPV